MRNGHLKLGDFALVKSLNLHRNIVSAGTSSQTSCYIAPEVMNGEMFDKSSDIWSLGCLLFELMELKCPVS